MAKLVLAGDLPGRLRGLLHREFDEDLALLLVPCHDIHTFGMRYAIDVAFLDKRGRVMDVRRDMMPNRRHRHAGSFAVLERFAAPDDPWVDVGDYLDVSTEIRRFEEPERNEV